MLFVDKYGIIFMTVCIVMCLLWGDLMKGIRVEKLFGRFDYEIELAEDGMTILTGPNGFGKSTILHIIDALANSNMEFFFELQFSEIEICSEEPEKNFLIKKIEDNLFIDGYKIDKQNFMDWKKFHLRHMGDELRDNEQFGSLMGIITKIIYALHNAVGEIFIIEEQRLVRSDMLRRIRPDGSKVFERKIIQVVEEIPDKLRVKMSRVASDYSRIANELDSTFPQRLFSQTVGLGEEEFDQKLISMREKVSKMQKYDITSIGKADDIRFKEEDARALKVYFDDFEKKYQKYEKLIRQLELFTDVVNKRFQFKKIYISRLAGIHIFDDNDNEIPLVQLSSGEKETLVLFYQMIFEVPEGSTLLIDEPEISLHIAWQRMFSEDLQAIIAEKGINAIIATHSVQIINGNKRIQRDLGKQYADRLNQGKLD